MNKAPVRLCCGERHFGAICNDDKVMCQLCFDRFPQDQLNVGEDGSIENVCEKCALEEKEYSDILQTDRTRQEVLDIIDS